MRPRNADASTVALLLAQRLTELAEPPLKARDFWTVMEAVDDPASLLGQTSTDISDATALPVELAQRVAARLEGATGFAIEREQLQQSGIAVVSPLDEDYPSSLVARLGRGAPPILYVAGSSRLMVGPSLGIVGSRDVGPHAATVAQDAARRAVERGYGVVSGGAKGVDQLAMRAALESGGEVVAVLADSLVRQLREPETREAVIDGRVCLCTPYKPTAGFSVANAMGRNKLIYALAEATFVVASDHEKGGTWAGAVEALKADYTDVVVWSGEECGSGNPALIGRGGRPLSSLDALFPFVVKDAPRRVAIDSADQLALDV